MLKQRSAAFTGILEHPKLYTIAGSQKCITSQHDTHHGANYVFAPIRITYKSPIMRPNQNEHAGAIKYLLCLRAETRSMPRCMTTTSGLWNPAAPAVLNAVPPLIRWSLMIFG